MDSKRFLEFEEKMNKVFNIVFWTILTTVVIMVVFGIMEATY